MAFPPKSLCIPHLSLHVCRLPHLLLLYMLEKALQGSSLLGPSEPWLSRSDTVLPLINLLPLGLWTLAPLSKTRSLWILLPELVLHLSPVTIKSSTFLFLLTKCPLPLLLHMPEAASSWVPVVSPCSSSSVAFLSVCHLPQSPNNLFHFFQGTQLSALLLSMALSLLTSPLFACLSVFTILGLPLPSLPSTLHVPMISTLQALWDC